MLLKVEVSAGELEESGRVLSVGDQEQFWLTFDEAERRPRETERVNLVRGVAVPLPTWPGAGFGRHPVRIDLEGAALYWDAPEQVTGTIEVAGTISSNTVDAPEGFPKTSGLLRRVRMMWADFVMSPERVWLSTGEGARYEEVTSTSFPVREPTVSGPEVEAELREFAREACAREMAAGRWSPGDSFEIGLKIPASNRKTSAGTTETRWTGVLIDLETR